MRVIQSQDNIVVKDRINEKQRLRSGSMTDSTVPESEELSMTDFDDEDQLPKLSPSKVKGKNAQASALMHMVAEEMVNSFYGGEEEDQPDSERRLRFIQAKIESARKKTRATQLKSNREAASKETTTNDDASSVVSASDASTNAVSIGEIRRYVLEKIPEEIKDQVPDDAWSAIFNDTVSLGSSSKVSKVDSIQKYCDADSMKRYRNAAADVSNTKSPIEKLMSDEGSAEIRIDDNASVSSELTGRTSDTSCKKGEEDEDAYDPRSEILKFLRKDSPDAESDAKEGVPDRQTTVTFDVVEVREYERVLSDTPCQFGPSIGLGWKYDEAQEIDVNDWENTRGQPRNPSQMLIPRNQRETMLRELGYSRKDLATSIRNNTKIRNQRRQTINNLSAQRMEETIEMAKRKVKSILRFGLKNGVIRKKRRSSTGAGMKQPSLTNVKQPVPILKVSQ